MGFFDGIAGAALGMIGGLFDSNSRTSSASEANDTNYAIAQMNNEFNADQANLNRVWQGNENLRSMTFSADQAKQAREWTESMSNTAWQRGVVDMRRAGLNPMLAVSQGGASTPVSPSPSGVSSGGASASSAGNPTMQPTVSFNRFGTAMAAVSTALDLAIKKEQAKEVAARVRNVDADTTNKLLLPDDIQAGIQLKGSQSYQATTQGNVNQKEEEKLLKTIEPIVDSIRASAAQSQASAEQTRSQNLAIKDLMANPATRPFAPLLQLFLQSR